MNKKGLGVGEVFTYIVVVLTFGLIVVFGYKAINEFLQSGQQVEFVQFKTDLENSIKQIYTEFGSVRVEKFRVPSHFEQICFVNLDYQDKSSLPRLCELDVVACNIWEDATGYETSDVNVFLTPDAPKIKVHKITLRRDGQETGFLCLPIRKGLFSVRMEGKGDHTELSP